MQEHNAGHMKFLLTFSGPSIVICIFFIYWYLVQIEVNKTLSLPTGLESVGSHDDFTKKKKQQSTGVGGLEEEPESPEKPQQPSMVDMVEEEERPRRYRITKLRSILLLIIACALSLLTYLLLVVSNASLWLSLLGVACVLGLGLWQQISEELRRQRLDRISAIITLIFLTASFMSLASYARQSLNEGEIYQGQARIIGFDYDNYDNSVGDVTRTDLEVAWGGRWGCPDVDNKQCTAFVQGAMCEAEKKEGDDDGKLRRILNDNNNDNGNDNNDGEEQAEEEENEELEEDVEEEEEENEDLEEDIEDEENENEELEEEVEEESEELEEYEEYTEELEEEVIDMEDYTYYYDDDMMYDSYWDEQDWGNVWGDYACYDLFDYDMSGSTYNADEAPGKDDWPMVNIFGNCNSCEAYIVDYYSTQHFQSMQDYRIQGRNYLLLSLVGVAVTAFLHVKYKVAPINDAELELMSNDGGAMA